MNANHEARLAKLLGKRSTEQLCAALLTLNKPSRRGGPRLGREEMMVHVWITKEIERRCPLADARMGELFGLIHDGADVNYATMLVRAVWHTEGR